MIISFTIPDAVAPRLIDALAAHYRYDVSMLPTTKQQYVKTRIIAEWKEITGEYEARTASATAKTSVNTDIVIA
jgi:hypothetical protein